MPRVARIVAKGYPHHVMQRGNNKQVTYFEDEDYRVYLELFEKYRKKHDLDVISYCPMPNHVHFSVIPKEEHSLAKVFQSCHMRYAQYFNEKYDRTGHLWQCRFYSCPMDNRHLYLAVKYIENNPVRAKRVQNPEDWKWSSARTHLKGEKSIITLTDANKLMNICDWEAYLNEQENSTEMEMMRNHTFSGKPLGNPSFIESLYKTFGDRVKPRPMGRPKSRDRALF